MFQFKDDAAIGRPVHQHIEGLRRSAEVAPYPAGNRPQWVAQVRTQLVCQITPKVLEVLTDQL
jgi:hypothetical protein